MAAGQTETFRFAEADLIQAARLFAGKNLSRPKVIVAYISLWFAGLILFTYLVTGKTDPSAIASNPGLILGLSILPFAIILAWTLWLIPTLARRNFRQQRSLHGDFGYAWTDDKLTVKTEYGSFDMPWSHFPGWTENDKILLLFESDRLYRVFPKRVLSPQQLTDLRHHFAKADA
ncbi:MAG: YcxB family protein [Candidatus Devosia phytovorans]|uniref:YcxB family protein n=1 Tax=Candidatus Devosia phytovorans TaxID=3121372 RepID=A0AAJ5VW36_9HYPH|nr:YcxB family protein [Devosia sp.]WEK04474.1 MAG: YcxB family protein [Devosia sp.]